MQDLSLRKMKEIMIEVEKESFVTAAKESQKYGTPLIFMENGKVTKRYTTPTEMKEKIESLPPGLFH